MILISTATTAIVHHSTVSPDFPLSLLHVFPAVVVFASLVVAVFASPVVEHPFVLHPYGLVDPSPGVVAADLT